MLSALKTLQSLKHPILNGSLNTENETRAEDVKIRFAIILTEDKILFLNHRYNRRPISTEAEVVKDNTRKLSKAKKRAATEHLTSWTLDAIPAHLVDQTGFVSSNNSQSNPSEKTESKFFKEVPHINANNTKKIVKPAPPPMRLPDETTTTTETKDDIEAFSSFISEIRQISNQISKNLNQIDEIDLNPSKGSELYSDTFSNFVGASTTESTNISATTSAIPTAVLTQSTEEPIDSSLIPSSDLHSVVVSNYGRFINDQCTRTMTAIAGEYHIRQLDLNAKTAISELSSVDAVIDSRMQKGIDLKFDMAFGTESETVKESEEDNFPGKTPAMQAQLRWLDEVRQLMVHLQEFLSVALQNQTPLESFEGGIIFENLLLQYISAYSAYLLSYYLLSDSISFETKKKLLTILLYYNYIKNPVSLNYRQFIDIFHFISSEV